MEIPKRLQSRPLWGGYPVPYVATVDRDGKPDFRVVDLEKWHVIVNQNLCSLCGEPNDYWIYFIGGDMSINETRLFFDPAAHHECSIYALKVCPYLAMGRERSERPVTLHGIKTNTVHQAMDDQPEVFGLGKTRGYKLVRHEGKLLIEAKPWASVTWWKHGETVATPKG